MNQTQYVETHKDTKLQTFSKIPNLTDRDPDTDALIFSTPEPDIGDLEYLAYDISDLEDSVLPSYTAAIVCWTANIVWNRPGKPPAYHYGPGLRGCSVVANTSEHVNAYMQTVNRYLEVIRVGVAKTWEELSK